MALRVPGWTPEHPERREGAPEVYWVWGLGFRFEIAYRVQRNQGEVLGRKHHHAHRKATVSGFGRDSGIG